MNLAHNAVQHTAENDTIAIGTTVDEDEIRISVRDTGTGISSSDQAKIFGRFPRGSGAHLLYPGGGLGLAIVKAVAEAHGGRVELDELARAKGRRSRSSCRGSRARSVAGG